MGDDLFKKINNGETTVKDGKILKYVLAGIFIAGILIGIAIGIG